MFMEKLHTYNYINLTMFRFFFYMSNVIKIRIAYMGVDYFQTSIVKKSILVFIGLISARA